jgi:hypothetical protein
MSSVKREAADSSSSDEEESAATTQTFSLAHTIFKRPPADGLVHFAVQERPEGPGRGAGTMPYRHEWADVPLWLDPASGQFWVDSEPGREFQLVVHNNTATHNYACFLYLDGKEALHTVVQKRSKVTLSQVNLDQWHAAPLVWGAPQLEDLPEGSSYNLQEQTRHLGHIRMELYDCVHRPRQQGEPRARATVQARKVFALATVQAPQQPEKRDIAQRTPAISVATDRIANLTRVGKSVPSRWYRGARTNETQLQYGPAERRPARYSQQVPDVSMRARPFF